MFIAIVGTRFAGKSTVQSFLVKHKGFIPVAITQEDFENGRAIYPSSVEPHAESNSEKDKTLSLSILEPNSHRVSSLSMMSPISLNPPSPSSRQEQSQPMVFRTTAELLSHVTKNWRTNFVTLDLETINELTEFLTRPFVLVVGVDAPILTRYKRCAECSLEEFIEEHDRFFYQIDSGGYGQDSPRHDIKKFAHDRDQKASYRTLSQLATIHVVNTFQSITLLHQHLEEINLLDPERLRPGWDTYFMQLASLASQRSNCMKRRVGAILVRNKRVLSSGYNGTPRGVTNCNEGGCKRCNTASETSDECLCLHAEENALLEAGRERVGDGSVLYCNTCPCLKCTIKIIQTGVKEVVYNLSYKVDDASASLFAEAGIILRRHAPV